MYESDAIGIDLGTTFCRVAVFRNGKVEIIKNTNNEEATPSVMAFQEDRCFVGDDALGKLLLNRQSDSNLRDMVFNVKRLIGRKIDDDRVLRDREYSQLRLTEVDSHLNVKVDCQNGSYSPEEITGILLSGMKKDAERYLNYPVKKAMITVPSSFNNSQRQSTVKAGILAGFETVQLINEPTAIAINFYHDQQMEGKKKFCVIHLGGGSFDVSIIKIENGELYEVESSVGSSHLGGVDFDQRLTGCFVDKYGGKKNETFRAFFRRRPRVRKACEQAKIALSTQDSVTISVEGYCQIIKREEYERNCKDLYDEMRYHVETLFKKSTIERKEIDDVLIVGGPTQASKMQEFLTSLFHQKSSSTRLKRILSYFMSSVDKKTSFHHILNQPAVRGAAIHAATSSSRKIVELVPNVIEYKGSVQTNGVECHTIVLRKGRMKKKVSHKIPQIPHHGAILKIYEEEGDWIPNQSSTKTLIKEIEIPGTPFNTPESSFNVVFKYDENCILTVDTSRNPLPDNDYFVPYDQLKKKVDRAESTELNLESNMENERAEEQTVSTEINSDLSLATEQNPETKLCATKRSSRDSELEITREKRKHDQFEEPSEVVTKVPKVTSEKPSNQTIETPQAPPKLPSKVSIGIDIGTTSSRVAVFHNGRINVLDNENGKKTTPSTVKFTEVETLVGENGGLNVTNSILNVKRLLGKKFDDPVVQSDIKYCSYNVHKNNSQPVIEMKIRNRDLTPEEVSSFIIRKMKKIAENFVEAEIINAVITVPSSFKDRHRQATKDAAAIAGFNNVQLINSSTAAAVAYYIENPAVGKRNMFVLTFGGGSIEASILTINGSDIRMRYTFGYNHLGGVSFDERLIQHCIREFENKYPGKDLSKNKRSMYKLREACVEVKRKLSFLKEAEVDITSLFDDEDFQTIITRKKFEQLCRAAFRDVVRALEKAFSQKKINKSQIDDILLIGGTTRIPKVQAIIKDFFGGEDKIRHSVNFDEACVYGSAVVAAKHYGVDDKNIMNLKIDDPPPKMSDDTGKLRLSQYDIGVIIDGIEKMDLKAEEYKKLSEAKNELEEYTLLMKRKLKQLKNQSVAEKLQMICEQTLEWVNSDENVELKEVVGRLDQLKEICESNEI